MIWLLREFSRSLPQPARCATWCHLAENENSCENSSQDSKFSCRSVEKRKIDTNLIALDAGNAIAALLLLDFASQFTSRVTMAIWHKHLFFDACNHYPSEYLQANCQAVSLGLTRSCLGSFGGRARKKTWSASSCIISSFENWEQPQKTAWKTTHVVRANCDPQRFF